MMFRCVIVTLMTVLITTRVVQNGCSFRIKMVAQERRSCLVYGRRPQILEAPEQHSSCTMISRRSNSQTECKCSSSVTLKFVEEVAVHRSVKLKNWLKALKEQQPRGDQLPRQLYLHAEEPDHRKLFQLRSQLVAADRSQLLHPRFQSPPSGPLRTPRRHRSDELVHQLLLQCTNLQQLLLNAVVRVPRPLQQLSLYARLVQPKIDATPFS